MRFSNALCALILAAAPAVAMAQDEGTEKAPLGLIIGLNSAKFTGEYAEARGGAGRRLGVLLGFNTIWRISPMIAIQPELVFSQQGGKLNFESEGDVGELTVKVHMIRLPILARLGPAASGTGMGWHIVAGPSIEYRLNCKGSLDVAGSYDHSIRCNDATDNFGADFNNYLYGGVAGGGVDFNFMQRSMSLDGRYSTTFTSFLKKGRDLMNPTMSLVLTIGI
jgi:hypothetical protein